MLLHFFILIVWKVIAFRINAYICINIFMYCIVLPMLITFEVAKKAVRYFVKFSFDISNVKLITRHIVYPPVLPWR